MLLLPSSKQPKHAAREPALIRIDDIRYAYDGASLALDGVSLHVASGEFVCIAGGNGSGKSTLAKHLNALLVPDSGTVTIDGMQTTSTDCVFDIRRTVALVMQNPDDAIVASTVEDEVAFGPANLGTPAQQLRERVTESLEMVGLRGLEKREVFSLSGGQKQRLALASALAMSPKVLILDEATSMLDPEGRASVLRIAHALHSQGMTVILITHDMDEALQADRLILLSKGTIAADGAPDQVLTDSALLEAIGLQQPFALRLSHALRQRGLPVDATCDNNQLKEALCSLHASR